MLIVEIDVAAAALLTFFLYGHEKSVQVSSLEQWLLSD